MTQDSDDRTPAPPALLEAYRQMLTCLFVSTVVLIVLIAIPLSITAVLDRSSPGVDEADLPIFAFVPFCGALGAFFSALMRLYSITELPAALLHVELAKLRNRYLLMYSLIPPIVGMIGASVFYIAAAGELVGGELFPKFTCKIEDCDSFIGLFNYGPEKVQDYAKALVWAFLAGFSERLVPDSLRTLSAGRSK